MIETNKPTIDLIIIGNGFDLAHGMETAYSDYIRAMLLDALSNAPKYEGTSPFYLGKDIIKVLRTEKEIGLAKKVGNLSKKSQSLDQARPNEATIQAVDLTKLYRDVAKARHYTLSPLVSLLIEDFEKKGWVDLEQSYFDVLCTSYIDREAVEQLNEDMRLLEKSLHSYLGRIKRPHKHESIQKHIEVIKDAERQHLQVLAQKKISEIDELTKLAKQQKSSDPKWLYQQTIERQHKKIQQEISSITIRSLQLENQKLVVLNFNYTDTIGLYFKEDEYIHIPIHNTLNDKEIILGYGDETCEVYKTLENANDNNLLKYFKSFYYMRNPYYRELERIVSSNNFRIHIMGHSCGLSDRVLLSSLFNHENLQAIRIYYYEKEKDKNDYFEKCQNISRHFLKKHQMRCKIIPNSTANDPMHQSVPLIPYYTQRSNQSNKK